MNTQPTPFGNARHNIIDYILFVTEKSMWFLCRTTQAHFKLTRKMFCGINHELRASSDRQTTSVLYDQLI